MKAELQRNDAFEIWCWRRLLRVPWTTRRSNQSILKEINPEYHCKDWCLSWSCTTLATWCEELTHWKRPWCWGRLWQEKKGISKNVFNVLVGWHHWLNGHAAAAKSRQSCPTFCDPIDGSPLGSPVPGILQARILEWVAVSFSNAWKWKVKVKLLSRVWLFTNPWTVPYQAPPSMGFSRQEYWSGVPLPSPQCTWVSANSGG